METHHLLATTIVLISMTACLATMTVVENEPSAELYYLTSKQTDEGHRKHVNMTNEKSTSTHESSSDNLYGGGHTSIANAVDNSRKTIDNLPCQLVVDRKSVDRFRHLVYFQKANYVYLNLTPVAGSGIELKKANWTVGENIWIWTFWGQEGAFEFLRWPTEFGIWSLGLLYESTIYEPMTIFLNKNGSHRDCSDLRVGNRDDDLIIAEALKSLAFEMMDLGEDSRQKYGPSFFCYKKRVIIDPYALCKHIVCPIEAIRHSCCNIFYNITVGGRVVVCREQDMVFDEEWWIIPSIISMILFCYSPILLAYLMFVTKRKDCGRVKVDVRQTDHPETIIEALESNNQPQNEFVLLEGHNHVTLFNSLSICFPHCQNDSVWVLVRTIRIFIPLLSVSVISLQVLVDYYVLNEYVHEFVDTGVPMGFRSLLVGYKKSKKNFLPFFGGPFVALGCYLAITALMVILPRSPLQLLTGAVMSSDSDHSEYESSPLWIRERNKELLGSINISRCEGLLKPYNLLLAQLSMLINVKFWKHVFCIQFKRVSRKCGRYMWYIVLPFYFVFCVLELLLAIIVYGVPVVSFGMTIIKAYCKPYSDICPRGIVRVAWLIGVSIAVIFFLFMFFTIFLDATLLMIRLMIFTLTGLIIFPKTAYGYMIFAFTVFYYLWDSFSDYSASYNRLLNDLIRIAKSLQRGNEERQNKIVFSVNGRKGIRETLFEFIIERHQPRRKKIVITFIRVFTVIGMLWFCISLLVKTQNFRELHVIMHVGTALFICALPQIAKRVCTGKSSKETKSRHLNELRNSVIVYLGYFTDGNVSSDYEFA